jgi:protein-disulfide isomerase
MRLLPLGLILAAVLTLPSAGCSAKAESQADQEFGAKVRTYLMAHPEVIQEAVDKMQTEKQAALDKASKDALASHREAVERDPRDYVAGNPNGKITVVEYFDYRCPYCKAAAPAIQKMIADNKDIRFVLKEFPILSEVSDHASKAALGAKAEGKYLPIHFAMLAEKSLDDEAIDRILKENGVDPAKAKAVGADEASTKQLADNHELAKVTGVNGTPAFVIGDTMVAGWDPDQIQAAIVAERKKG